MNILFLWNQFLIVRANCLVKLNSEKCQFLFQLFLFFSCCVFVLVEESLTTLCRVSKTGEQDGAQ